MKLKMKRIGSVVFTLVLTISMLNTISNIMQLKTSDIKHDSYFEVAADCDVLFYGSSHMVDGVYPMELWNDYGIASYNLAGNGNRIATCYWVMKNSFDYSNPKLVVVDCALLGQIIKADYNFSYLHMTFDAFPFSVNKVKSVMDCLDDPVAEAKLAEGNIVTNGEQRTPVGLLWDFSVYHSRWNELGKEDFVNDNITERGAESLINVADPAEEIYSSETLDVTTVSEEYLRRIVEECQSRGIDVLLTYLPFPATENDWKEANTAAVIAEEYNINYINFLSSDVVDYDIDTYDGWAHLNPSGARKITSYLGQYITDNYEISDRRGDAISTTWNKDYENYQMKQAGYIEEQSSLANILMLLYKTDNDVRIDFNGNYIWKDSKYRSLLSNIGVDTDKLSEKTSAVVISNGVATIVTADNEIENEPLHISLELINGSKVELNFECSLSEDETEMVVSEATKQD